MPVPRSAQREPPLQGRWAAAKRLGGVFCREYPYFHPSVSLLRLTAPLQGSLCGFAAIRDGKISPLLTDKWQFVGLWDGVLKFVNCIIFCLWYNEGK